MTRPAPAPAGTAALLAQLVDDAGLFPPASLPMGEAVDAHLAARAGQFRWMLGRFVCPAHRIDELDRAARGDAAESLRLTVLLGADASEWTRSAEAVTEVVKRRGWTVELVEAPLPDAAVADRARELVGIAGDLGADRAFVELPWSEFPLDRLGDAVETAAGAGAGIKVRCGGLTADAFPPPALLASVLASCRDASTPMKATAGLHHPFRHPDPETGAVMHGFVNLAVAAVLATVHGLGEGDLAAVLADDDEDAFVVDTRVGWRDLDASQEDVARARRDLFVGFGSCSFREPVDDLVALGILTSA
ncbi:MAG TPA: hypothetical protein VF230_12965 [Acidimicrobiales bacterium]